MLAMALSAMESMVISTVVPQIVSDLGGFSLFSWLFSGYLLAVTVTLPVYGKLSDIYGRKPVLLFGIVIFLIGSLLCAGAWDMASLIAFRVVQGVGGGAIQGTVQTIAADLYGLKERAKVTAALNSVWAVSAVSGPFVGGLLAGYADWRWIFLINLPIGALALILIVRYLHENVVVRTRRTIDWPGALGLFASGGLLLLALVQGGVAWPWFSAPSLSLFGAGALCAAATVWIERRAAEPIIPGWVWRRRQIVAVNLALFASGAVVTAPTVFLPTYAQSVLGLGPIAAGLVLSAMSMSWPVAGALSSHVYLRIGFRDTSLIGISAAVLVLWALVMLPYAGPAWQLTAVMLALGAAFGLYQLPLLVGVQSSVGWAERATTTSSVLFCRQLGMTAGAALYGAVANATLASRLAEAPVDGLPTDVDGISSALSSAGTLEPASAEYLRQALATAIDHVYVGAALAGTVAFLVVLFVAPRRFPVLADD
ncbi:MDR family MFS transporter [Streptomyces sp. NPDC087658]|uniref:MDR family MFS transporter n=1 Tax=Streptomyces sp. NPDC087658 TaxID=3365800 RepID=UPI00382D5B3E